MSEKVYLFDGQSMYSNLLSDLSQVMDHCYDINELFLLYPDWVRHGEDHVDQVCSLLFPPKHVDSEDDFVGLRNAMINLYCHIDDMLLNLNKRTITHVAYCNDESTLAITTR